MKKNPYVVLGVSRGADLHDIKQAYRRAAKRSHPDLCGDPDGRTFHEIQDAYDTLTDRKKRRVCDAEIDESSRSGGPRRCNPRRPSGEADGRKRRLHPDPAPALRKPGAIRLEIRLSPDEASTGGAFPIRLPVDRPCSRCGGAFPWRMICPACDGAGLLQHEERFLLRIPPGIGDGARASVPLEQGGLSGGVLHLLFRIDPQAA